MIVTAHQPAYLPWLGYFDKILRSDVYVFMDNVQFENRSFINRNRIKTPKGPIWLTVPVLSKGHREATMMTLEIDNTRPWQKDHLNALFYNYKKALRFDACYAKLEDLYRQEFTLLNDLCMAHLHFWLRELGREDVHVVRLSELPIASKKSDLILDICRHFKADGYISGALGRDYLETARFEEAGIAIEFQNYPHPVYPQLWGEFIPNLAIVDCWMNTPDYARIITGGSNHDVLHRVGTAL